MLPERLLVCSVRLRISLLLVMLVVLPRSGIAADYPGNCGSLCVYIAALSEGAELPPYDKFVQSHRWAQKPLCSLEDQLQTLQSLGVSARLVEWPSQTPPKNFSKIIAHQDVEHFVILKRSSDPSGTLLLDPPKSERPLLRKDWMTFSGLGIEFGDPQAPPGSNRHLWWIISTAFLIGIISAIIYGIRPRKYRGSSVRGTRNGAIETRAVVAICLTGVMVFGVLWCIRVPILVLKGNGCLE